MSSTLLFFYFLKKRNRFRFRVDQLIRAHQAVSGTQTEDSCFVFLHQIDCAFQCTTHLLNKKQNIKPSRVQVSTNVYADAESVGASKDRHSQRRVRFVFEHCVVDCRFDITFVCLTINTFAGATMLRVCGSTTSSSSTTPALTRTTDRLRSFSNNIIVIVIKEIS